MKNLEEYLIKARKELNLPSEYALAKILGIKQPSLVMMRQGKARPSEETMLKIATLAKVDPKEALIDLAIWRAEDKGYHDVKSVWKSLSKMLCSFLLITLLNAPINTQRTLTEQNKLDNHITINYATIVLREMRRLPF